MLLPPFILDGTVTPNLSGPEKLRNCDLDISFGVTILPKIHSPAAARGATFRPELLHQLAITFLTLLKKKVSTLSILPTLASRLSFVFLVGLSTRLLHSKARIFCLHL